MEYNRETLGCIVVLYLVIFNRLLWEKVAHIEAKSLNSNILGKLFSLAKVFQMASLEERRRYYTNFTLGLAMTST